MSLKYKGYHGTTRDNADKIMDMNLFFPSTGEEEWLGTGVYFFEDIYQALHWCTQTRRYPYYAVLVSKLNSDNVFDLTNMDHLQEFMKMAKSLKDRYKTTKDRHKRKLINAVVLNFLYKVKPFDMVRAAFNSPVRLQAERVNVLPVQIQLCVKNNSCITGIEEVDCCGY